MRARPGVIGHRIVVAFQPNGDVTEDEHVVLVHANRHLLEAHQALVVVLTIPATMITADDHDSIHRIYRETIT